MRIIEEPITEMIGKLATKLAAADHPPGPNRDEYWQQLVNISNAAHRRRLLEGDFPLREGHPMTTKWKLEENGISWQSEGF
jgi:hypothetical protein